MEMNDFESKVIRALAEFDKEKDSLLSQIEVASVVERDYSGVGLFTKFSVPSSAPNLDLNRTKMEDYPACYLVHPELEAGAGVILWLSNGKIDTLECFAYGAEWPENESLFQVKT